MGGGRAEGIEDKKAQTGRGGRVRRRGRADRAF